MDIKYDNYTVNGLKALARNRGLRGYSRLRRQELIQFLNLGGSPILDTRVKNINVPILQPTVAQPLPTVAQPLPTTRQRPTTSVNDLLKSLENVRVEQPSISPELNALKKKIKKIYSKIEKINIKLSKSALRNYAEEYKIEEIEGIPVATPQEFLALTQPSIIKILTSENGVKVKLNLQCLMARGESEDIENLEIVKANFSSGVYEIKLEGTNVTKLYNEMVERIFENFDKFIQKGSEWYFYSVVHLKLHSVIYEPINGGEFIPLPDWIKNKKACINMLSNNNECFTDCILRHLNPTTNHPERADSNLKSKKNS